MIWASGYPEKGSAAHIKKGWVTLVSFGSLRWWGQNAAGIPQVQHCYKLEFRKKKIKRV